VQQQLTGQSFRQQRQQQRTLQQEHHCGMEKAVNESSSRGLDQKWLRPNSALAPCGERMVATAVTETARLRHSHKVV
jgi:hypothetical protein